MPNIIEQQDLLKGLPDDRLSTLMQNPTGDIPPFLVAAEAQRRQSIREQFSGGPQESVVDTLMKQMSGVPQNIQAPAQQPPQMPPPPQGGVADLQQGMRSGGYVQRYQSLGLVTPLQTRVQDIADQFGVTVEQAAEMMKNNPSLSGTREPAEYGASLPVTETNREAMATPSLPDLPTLTISPAEYAVQQKEAAREAKYQEMDSYPGYSGLIPSIMNSGGYDPLSSIKPRTASPVSDPRDPNSGKGNTSIDNQSKTDMTVDEYKKYLEDIYGVKAEDSEYIRNKIKEMYSGEERSGWESAQKWFAAAQAAIQPGQTDMQAAINALSALGGGYAEERAADRASKRDMEEALLKQEIADRQAAGQSERDIAKAVLDFRLSQEESDRAARAAAKEAQLGGFTKQADYAMKKAEMYARLSGQERDKLDSLVSDLRRSGMVSEEEISKNPEVQKLLKRIDEINILQQNALAESKLGMERYGEKTGSGLFFETADGVNPIRPGQ